MGWEPISDELVAGGEGVLQWMGGGGVLGYY